MAAARSARGQEDHGLLFVKETDAMELLLKTPPASMPRPPLRLARPHLVRHDHRWPLLLGNMGPCAVPQQRPAAGPRALRGHGGAHMGYTLSLLKTQKGTGMDLAAFDQA